METRKTGWAMPRLRLTQKRQMMFYVFTLPFTVGFVLFFLNPFIKSVVFSLNELKMTRTGYDLLFVGLGNYRYALLTHPDFVRVFVETTLRMLLDVPLILVFSLVAAVILNQKFRGRLLVRVVFFLPVILGAGIILRYESVDYRTALMETGVGIGESTGFFDVAALQDLISRIRLPGGLTDYLIAASNKIPVIIRGSAVQTLIFLAGLQSISPSLYEAAEVEGSTGWERFWLITLPMLSPLVIVNLVYSIIDSFMAGDNQLLRLVHDTAFGGGGYGISTAMALMYFAAVSLILVVVMGIALRWVFYHD